jgi:hypothetical protein
MRGDRSIRRIQGDTLLEDVLCIDNVHSITNQLLIKEMVSERLGLIVESKPFALVTFSENTNYYKDTISRLVSKKMMKWGIPEMTGESITTLLNLPIYELHNLIDVAREVAIEKAKTKNNILDGVTKELGI